MADPHPNGPTAPERRLGRARTRVERSAHEQPLVRAALGLDALVPQAMVFELWPIADHEGELLGGEATAIGSAVTRRRHEFSTGRATARAALRRLGLPPLPIEVGSNREPLVPRGAVASITHDDGWCICVAGRSEDFESVGVDITTSEPLDLRLHRMILTVGERQRGWCDRALPFDVAKLVFSAKESLYKLLHPMARRFIGFGEAEIDVDADRCEWRARLVGPKLADFRKLSIEGHYRVSPDNIVTLAWIRAGR